MQNSSYISHHGIKGQRWGERNGPPYPLGVDKYSKAEAKAQLSKLRSMDAARTKKDVDRIINSMTKTEKEMLLMGDEEYLTEQQGEYVVNRVLKKIGGTPVAFFDIIDAEGDSLNIAIGTRGGKKYRKKGYASEVAKTGLDWVEENKDWLNKKKLYWGVRKDNAGSIAVAKKYGFKLKKDQSNWGDLSGEWETYYKDLN